MSPYLWLLLLASGGSAFAAGIILGRDPASQANRVLALLGIGSAFWGLCQVAWNLVEDPELALVLVRLSALGWIWIGPMFLHILVAATEQRSPRALLPLAYGLAALLLLIDWTTPWMVAGVVRTDWGWAALLGPVFPVYYGLTIGGCCAGVWVGYDAFRRFASPGERRQGVLGLAAIAVPLVVASLTDALLPMAGIQLPRLGTLAMGFLLGTVAWSFHRFGFSILAPGRFAPEILDALCDGVALTRLNGRIRIANRSLAQLVGRRPEQLRGISIATLLPAVSFHPPRELHAVETELVVGSEERLPVSVSSSLLQDTRGLAIGHVLVVHDQREVVALRQRLVTSGRLAAVGQLAAGIAHEINNPVAYIRANLGLLRSHWGALAAEVEKGDRASALQEILAEGEELIDESLEGVERAAAIVRDVKGFSHAGGERQPVDLNELVDQVLRIAAPQLGARAQIEKRYGEIPSVFGTAPQLQQVFLNLVLNASQAVEPGGSIRVTTAVEEGEVVVRVDDDGCGIPPELLARIFDPFFTTKAVGEGTGLGLAIAYEIARSHGGDITVASKPGKGTTFAVHLPIASP